MDGRIKRCECCGQPVPAPLDLCECSHPIISHNDNGGRNKKAYCTVWVHPNGDPRKPMVQCACVDARMSP